MTIENMTLAEAINEHGIGILETSTIEEAVAGGFKDGYHVTGGRNQSLQHSPTDPHKTSSSAIRHADKVEDTTGYQAQVHHVKDGKIHKSWDASGSHFGDSNTSRFYPHTEYKGEDAHHILGHRMYESTGISESITNLTEAVFEKNALVVENLFNEIILEKISEILENPVETEITIADLVESYGENALDELMENLTLGDLVEEFGPEVLDELATKTLAEIAAEKIGTVKPMPGLEVVDAIIKGNKQAKRSKVNFNPAFAK